MKRRKTPFRRAALLDLGESLPVILPLLAKKLNGLQSSFEFNIVEPITLQSLGDPDEDPFYNVKKLHDKLDGHVDRSKYDVLLGITELKITNFDEPASSGERAYFSLSNFKGVGVVSVYSGLMHFKPVFKDEYQYLAFLTMCEVLINVVGQDLCHPRSEGCLFDDCEDRSVLVKGMDKAYICYECLSTLKKKNVSDRVLADVQNVLNWCKRNSLLITIRHFLNNGWVVAILATIVVIILGWIFTMIVNTIREHP